MEVGCGLWRVFGELELAGRMTCIGNSSSWRGSLIRKERGPPAQSCRLPRLITTREGAAACEQEHIPTLHLKGPVGCLTSTRGKLKTLYSSGQLTHTGRRSDQQLQRPMTSAPPFTHFSIRREAREEMARDGRVNLSPGPAI